MIQKLGGELLTARQAGELLGLSRQRIQQLRMEGKLTGFPVETVDYAYNRAEVLRLKRSRTAKAASRAAKRRRHTDDGA